MDYLDNICLLTDSYKVSHYKQYPHHIDPYLDYTGHVYSYFESRVGAKFPKTIFFGLQYFIKKYLTGRVVTQEKIDEAEALFNVHFGQNLFNRKGWEWILKAHDGHLPIEIKAIPEGKEVDNSNVLMTVTNTDYSYWLTNYLETILTQVWYPCTVATQSLAMKRVILGYLEKTGDPSLIDFKLHDFGFRGVTCPEQAAIGGAAHLLNFRGTDTFPACLLAQRFYGEEMAGFSIPASEHSTITSWGKDNEVLACKNMLDSYPTGNVAVVSDSYDIFKCCSEIWGKKLKNQIVHRDGTLIIRPDSGNPPEVVVKVLSILMDKFGYSYNNKKFKVLPPTVRIIQGDGIDYDMLSLILDEMVKNKMSADNIAFGSGGGLLQKLNRDTQKFAFKCSSISMNNKAGITDFDVYKKPITDTGKKSKAGKMKLVKTTDGYKTVTSSESEYESAKDELVTVFKDGELLVDYSFQEIRDRIKV